MADEYPVLLGIVQKFPDKDVITGRDVEVQGESKTVREFTVKASGSQALVRISLWPEWAHVTVDEGDFIAANGKFSSSEGKSATFYNLTPRHLHINGTKQERNSDDAPSEKKATKSKEETPF